jgi:hypothetical protein
VESSRYRPPSSTISAGGTAVPVLREFEKPSSHGAKLLVRSLYLGLRGRSNTCPPERACDCCRASVPASIGGVASGRRRGDAAELQGARLRPSRRQKTARILPGPPGCRAGREGQSGPAGPWRPAGPSGPSHGNLTSISRPSLSDSSQRIWYRAAKSPTLFGLRSPHPMPARICPVWLSPAMVRTDARRHADHD